MIPKYAHGSDTSRRAAESVVPHIGRLQVEILNHIIAAEGATCDELERALGLRHQTASARIHELVKVGLLRDSGTKRRTASGRSAVVWAHVKKDENPQRSLFQEASP
jgi:predicted transcriptional regulator